MSENANHDSVAENSKSKRKGKWKKRSIIILSIFIFLITFITLIIYTSLGVKITMFALNKYLPELKIQQVEGSFHNLHIQGLSLDLTGVHVGVEDASVKLSGLCLIQTKICLKKFDAKGINVQIDTKQFEDSENDVTDTIVDEQRFIIKTPLPIELKTTQLNNVKVNVDDMQFGMSSFTGKAIWVNEKIYVYPSVAMDLSAVFSDNTSPQEQKVENNLPINEQINQLFNEPLIHSLPQVSIPLDINVSSLTGDNWLLHIGGEDFRFNKVTIKTDMVNNHIMVKQVDTNIQTPFLNGHALVNGEITLGDDWPLVAFIKADTKENHLEGQFTGQLLGKLTTHTSVTGLNELNIDGHINFIEKYLPVMTKLSGKHIQWPVEGTAQYQLNNFDLAIDGNVEQYNLSAKGSIAGENLPSTTFDIAGNGTNQGATFNRGIINLPQGQIAASGNVNWQNSLQWNTNVKLNQVDLTKELPEYPIKLNGKLNTTGKLAGETWQFNVTDLDLKGKIKQADFSANGNLQVDSKYNLSANNLAVIWDKNQINVEGSTEKANLNAKLNLTSLALLVDEMQGSIFGNIKMAGTKSNPVIDTNLTIDALKIPNISISKANLTGKIHYQDQLNLQLKLIGHNIEVANQVIKKADIDLVGNESKHTLNIDLDGNPASFKTSLTGKIDKDHTKWSGNISNALLNFGNNNHWSLTQPLILTYDLNQQIPTVSAHCWHNNSSNICLDKPLSPAPNTQTTITLKNIDLARLPIPNDGETKLAGTVNGKAEIKFGNSNKTPAIKANITSNTIFVQQMVANQALPIPFDLFNINAEFNEQQAKLDWHFSLKQLGKINGDLVITDPNNQKKLSGQLIIDNLALAILNPLLDKNEYTKGAINGAVKFSGSLMDPYLTGNINLKQSEIKSNQLPIDIKSATVDIKLNGKSSNLQGVLKTQSGNVDINGNASWQNFDKWQANLTVNGAAMQVTVPPMIVMSIVPDVKINATQDELTLLGKVNIPKGTITVDSLPASSVDVSPDEVMLDRNGNQIEPQKFGMKINSHLEINIGDDVSVDAFGLKAKLKGHLVATQTNKGLDLHGEVLIPSGRFHAYGQDLIIRKGVVTFSGPSDRAQLDIEAIRNPDSMDKSNITAGIRVTGSSEDPRIDIFSDPTMSQQEALSYLIRGQGLDNSDQSENDMMTALLVGIGTSKTGKYIGDIGNIFGIKNLTLDTQGAGDSSKVVVSGYILPHLQLKYGVGIFDSLATFTLRYRLMPSLYLEATSGLAQALDVIYQFEF